MYEHIKFLGEFNGPDVQNLGPQACEFKHLIVGDAIDLFREAIKLNPSQENNLAKDIRYNLARAYEASSRPEEALEIYRKLAQLDFSYKDVSQRIDKLRAKGHNA